jgi:DUF971 family protein
MSPIEIRVSRNRKRLELAWPDGTRSRLAARYLRAHGRSSSDLRAAIDGVPAPVQPDVSIAELHLVGHYAINLIFSDGSDRGIYPWSYLRRLGEEAERHPP